MAEYQVWLVQPPGEVQEVLPELKQGETAPAVDPAKVKEVSDEDIIILIPNVTFREDAMTCMEALRHTKEVGKVLKLVEKKGPQNFAVRDWMPCDKPKVEFDAVGAAQAAAAGESAEVQTDGEGKVKGLALVPTPPGHKYPPNSRRKRK